jgi:hypothetical protein
MISKSQDIFRETKRIGQLGMDTSNTFTCTQNYATSGSTNQVVGDAGAKSPLVCSDLSATLQISCVHRAQRALQHNFLSLHVCEKRVTGHTGSPLEQLLAAKKNFELVMYMGHLP